MVVNIGVWILKEELERANSLQFVINKPYTGVCHTDACGVRTLCYQHTNQRSISWEIVPSLHTLSGIDPEGM